jgi:cytochrome P450
LIDEDSSVDRATVWARLRRDAPVFFSERLGSWVLTRYADVRAVISDEATFASLTDGPGAPEYGRTFNHWRGREHNKKAGVVAREIRSPRAVAQQIEPLVEGIVAVEAARLPLRSPVDLRGYTLAIPLKAVAELMGIPVSDELLSLYRDAAQGGNASISDPSAKSAGARALERLTDFVEPIIALRRRDPGTDLISRIATADFDGRPLPADEVLATVLFLLPAGSETTERALASGLALLANDRSLWRSLREERDDDAAILAFSVEILRLHAPVQSINRKALVPVTLHGQSIAVGDRLVCILAAANRDPSVFPNPDVFDADRWRVKPERQFAATGVVLPFGAGLHHCTGSRLVAVELVHGFRGILERATTMEPVGEIPAPSGFVLHGPSSVRVTLSNDDA